MTDSLPAVNTEKQTILDAIMSSGKNYGVGPAISALERLVRRAETAEQALSAIRDLPSEHDLLFNAEARAMYEIASCGLEALSSRGSGE